MLKYAAYGTAIAGLTVAALCCGHPPLDRNQDAGLVDPDNPSGGIDAGVNSNMGAGAPAFLVGTQLSILAATGAATVLGIDQDTLYWVDLDKLMAVKKSGGQPQILSSGLPHDQWDNQVKEIVVDDQYVYARIGPNGWSSSGMPGLLRVLKTGGPYETLFQFGAEIWSLTQDQNNLYWLSADTRTFAIYQWNKSGGTPNRLLAKEGMGIDPIASSGDELYAAAGHAGSVYDRDGLHIYRVAKTDGSMTDLGPAGLPSVIVPERSGVFVRAGNIYLLANGSLVQLHEGFGDGIPDSMAVTSQWIFWNQTRNVLWASPYTCICAFDRRTSQTWNLLNRQGADLMSVRADESAVYAVEYGQLLKLTLPQ